MSASGYKFTEYDTAKAGRSASERAVPGSPRAARYKEVLLKIDLHTGSRGCTARCLGLTRDGLRKRVSGQASLRNEHVWGAQELLRRLRENGGD